MEGPINLEAGNERDSNLSIMIRELDRYTLGMNMGGEPSERRKRLGESNPELIKELDNFNNSHPDAKGEDFREFFAEIDRRNNAE